MRHTNRRVRPTVVYVVLTALLAGALCSADAAERSYRWRTSKYGRKGAEVWVEAPRYAIPVGKDYKGDYDVRGGVGFGFGVMFAFSDKLALEGRMLQTTHKTAQDEKTWDIDQTLIGLRYGFRYERAFQPYVGLGGARLSFEYDPTESQATEFRRMSGYGAYGTLGLDYVASNRWVVGLRVDYVWMRYAESIVGTQSYTMDDPMDGSVIGMSLSVHYRVPVFW